MLELLLRTTLLATLLLSTAAQRAARPRPAPTPLANYQHQETSTVTITVDAVMRERLRAALREQVRTTPPPLSAYPPLNSSMSPLALRTYSRGHPAA
jgi:hypothetical protein